jgi:hypothetical protein
MVLISLRKYPKETMMEEGYCRVKDVRWALDE